ncbi:FUSC family protein [Streptomyces sp. NPDC051776]|uniref:FUSC family protein n=1 Tax=Streptomyces sp. NPDC051776 TaxID=3155414 RepID=UPI003419010F
MPGGIRLPRLRGPVLPSFRRALRITIAASTAFSLCRHAIGNDVMAIYAIFGVIALGGLSQIPGPSLRRARTLVVALPAVYALVAVGTLLAVNAWAAAAGMFAVGFLVTFSGVGGPRFIGMAAGLQLFYMLACFPPYEPGTLDSRLVGVTVGIGLLIAAELLLWPDPPPIPYERRLAEAAGAVAAYVDLVAGRLAGVPAEDQERGPRAVPGTDDRDRYRGAHEPPGGQAQQGRQVQQERQAQPAGEANQGQRGRQELSRPDGLRGAEAAARRGTEAIRPSRLPQPERPVSPSAKDRALSQAGAATRFVFEQVQGIAAAEAARPVPFPGAAELLRETARTIRASGRALVRRGAVPPDLDHLISCINGFQTARATRDSAEANLAACTQTGSPAAAPAEAAYGGAAPAEADRGGASPAEAAHGGAAPAQADRGGAPPGEPDRGGAASAEAAHGGAAPAEAAGEGAALPEATQGGDGHGGPGAAAQHTDSIGLAVADPGTERLRRGAMALQTAEGVRLLATGVRIAVGAPVPSDPTPRGERPGPFWFAYAPVPALWWRRVRASLTPRSVSFQNAVRVAVALALARLIAGQLDLAHGFWVLLATLSLMRTSAADTRTNLRPAFKGTLAGAVASGLILYLVGESPAFYEAAMPVALLVAFTLGPVLGLAWMQGLFTLAIATIFTQLATASWQLAEARFIDIVTGGVIGAVIGLLAWPRGGAGELRRAAAAFLPAAATAARETVAVLTGTGHPEGALPRARRAMFLADAAYAQYQSERPDPRMHAVDWQTAMVAGYRMVWGGQSLLLSCPPNCLAPWPRPATELQQAADRLRSAYDDLADRLRAGTEPNGHSPGRDTRDGTEEEEARDGTEPEEARDAMGVGEARDATGVGEARDTRDAMEEKEAEEPRDAKEPTQEGDPSGTDLTDTVALLTDPWHDIAAAIPSAQGRLFAADIEVWLTALAQDLDRIESPATNSTTPLPRP